MNETENGSAAHCRIGPSSLPARAVCPCHESAPGGADAQSGTRSHKVVEADIREAQGGPAASGGYLPGTTEDAMTDEAFQDRQRGKYTAALANLMPGARDANLVTVTLYGRQAGMTPDELYDDIMANAPGAKRPNPSAVRRAVEHAARTVELGGRKDFAAADSKAAAFDRIWTPRRVPTAAERREAARKALPDRVRGAVARLAAEGRGATSKTLREMSPSAIPSAPAEQAAAHLNTLGADWRWTVWAGSIGANVPGDKLGWKSADGKPTTTKTVCYANILPEYAEGVNNGMIFWVEPDEVQLDALKSAPPADATASQTPPIERTAQRIADLIRESWSAEGRPASANHGQREWTSKLTKRQTGAGRSTNEAAYNLIAANPARFGLREFGSGRGAYLIADDLAIDQEPEVLF